MDSGYDETQNPFADVSDEYTKKKEESMAKKAVKRMSAQQRQINKVHGLNIYTRVCVYLNVSYFKILVVSIKKQADLYLLFMLCCMP